VFSTAEFTVQVKVFIYNSENPDNIIDTKVKHVDNNAFCLTWRLIRTEIQPFVMKTFSINTVACDMK